MGVFETNMEKYICVQDVVYWANPVDDGRGGYTYDDPVEIKARWDDLQKQIVSADGEQLVCDAQVCVLEDLDIGGVLYLGTIEELLVAGYLAGDLSPARDVPGAYEIRRVDKIPMPGSTSDFFRMAYQGARSVL